MLPFCPFMKNILYVRWSILLLLSLCFTACKTISPYTLQNRYLVIRVIDGDTFCILNAENEQEKIRLIGVDAPETKKTRRKEIGYYGKESAEYLRKLILNKQVRLEYDIQKIDMYGRTLAYVYLHNGVFLNDMLVQKGYCKVATFPPNIRFKNMFIQSEVIARSKHRGLWNSKKQSKTNKKVCIANN